MFGPAKPRRPVEPIAVTLEDLVPANNFYLHLEHKLDLGSVRDWTRKRYAERGRPNIDPVAFFELQLVMFFEAIHFAHSGMRRSGASKKPGARKTATQRRPGRGCSGERWARKMRRHGCADGYPGRALPSASSS